MSQRQSQKLVTSKVTALEASLETSGRELTIARERAMAAESKLTGDASEMKAGIEQAEHAARRAVASALDQRRQIKKATDTIALLQSELEASRKELVAANANTDAANLSATTRAAGSSAKIAELQAELETAQRAARRAIASSVAARQQLTNASDTQAKLREQLAEREASATKLAVELAQTRTATEKAKSASAQIVSLTLQDAGSEELVDASKADDRADGSDSDLRLVEFSSSSEPATSHLESQGNKSDVRPSAERRTPAPRPVYSNAKPMRGTFGRRASSNTMPRRTPHWRAWEPSRQGSVGVVVVTRAPKRFAVNSRFRFARKFTR